jgi:endogenous inhibitor of DNA gyrase (YacG/DUF329 family)
MKKCPTCTKQITPQNNPFRPFCSERCKLIDLDKWVSEEYRVPGKPVPTEHSGETEDDRGSDSNSSEFKP